MPQQQQPDWVRSVSSERFFPRELWRTSYQKMHFARKLKKFRLHRNAQWRSILIKYLKMKFVGWPWTTFFKKKKILVSLSKFRTLILPLGWDNPTWIPEQIQNTCILWGAQNLIWKRVNEGVGHGSSGKRCHRGYFNITWLFAIPPPPGRLQQWTQLLGGTKRGGGEEVLGKRREKVFGILRWLLSASSTRVHHVSGCVCVLGWKTTKIWLDFFPDFFHKLLKVMFKVTLVYFFLLNFFLTSP